MKGSILILTLWLIVFLSTLLFMLGDQILGEKRVARASEISYQQFFARETLRARFEAALALDETKDYDALNDTWRYHPELSQEVKLSPSPSPTAGLGEDSGIGAIDEERFININKANLQLLKQLFMFAAGLDEEAALLMGAAVQDWRDLDEAPSHAEVDTEGSAYSNYPCKNNAFESVEELMLVLGMDKKIYEAIRPVVTVYGEGKVNINTVPKAVLMVLGAPESLADKIADYRAGDDGVEGTEDDGFFEDIGTIEPKVQAASGNLTTEELNALSQMKSQDWLHVKSDYFQLPVRLKAYGKLWTKRVVVKRSGKLLEINR